MKSTSWKDIAELIGLTAIVASLVFVGVQLQQDQDIAEAQIHIGATANVATISQSITENHSVWRRGLDGEDLTPTEQIAFNAIARAIYQRHFGLYSRGLRLDLASPEFVVRRFAFIAYQYKGMRQYLTAKFAEDEVFNGLHGRSGLRVFDQQIADELARLDEIRPSLPDKTYTAF